MEACTCPQCGDTFERGMDERWKRICINCFKENKRGESQRSTKQHYQRPNPKPEVKSGQIDASTLKKLMYLCHPDKHNNSQTSTDMFVWLSNLKKS